MLVVEYCPLGDLENFLKKNAKNYINQFDPNSDSIDDKIVFKKLSRNDNQIDSESDNINYKIVSQKLSNEDKEEISCHNVTIGAHFN